MVQLIVFDLDGTLVDSSRDLADATNALITDLGGSPLPLDAVTAMVGDGAAVLVKRALSEAGLDPSAPGALDRFLEHYDARLLATTLPYPGMMDTLDALRSTHRLAVLTNKPARAATRLLEGLGLLQSFDDVIGGDTAHGRKPNPEGLLALVARAGLTPDATVLVGDSPVDLATARRARTHLCVARYGFGYRARDMQIEAHDWVIDHPRTLLDIVKHVDRQI
jgi:phosphoglycolate phosphatase